MNKLLSLTTPLLAPLTALSLLSVAAAQTAPAPVKLASTSTVTPATLSLNAANRMAMLAVQNCVAKGYNVSATVVDRMGVTLAVARAENAGPHTLDSSLRKAYTSASGKNLTSEMVKSLANNPTLADIPGYLVLAGGVPVRVDNAVVGAVGVGGAPSGMIDEDCAQGAIKSVLR